MLKLTPYSRARLKTDHLSIPVCEDADIHENPDIAALIDIAKSLPEFSGEKGQQVTLYHQLEGAVGRCSFSGLGKLETLDAEDLRAFAGRSVNKSISAKRKSLTIAMPAAKVLPVPAQETVTALVEGACLANYFFNTYKQKPEQEPLKNITILAPTSVAKGSAELTARTEAVCRATLKAREWVNLPSNDKVPAQLANIFAKAVRGQKVKVGILNEKQLKEKKFGALLSVAAGSSHPARLVEMVYKPPKPEKTIVLVGKGVTFDTGGISLKPSAGMDEMKSDMAGAAAVAGTMMAIAELVPKHQVVGITPLVENMPSGTATRPGDIVKAYSGKTIEIGNTDAEGRLILADALAYAIKKYKPDAVVDLATLTGACMVALGQHIAGLFSKNDELADALTAAGIACHERCWRMPMPDDYKELLKSQFADVSNMSSTRYGGAITAALFLSEFTGDTSWAHIDIAGPAYSSKAMDYCEFGGTGFGVRLLCRLITDM